MARISPEETGCPIGSCMAILEEKEGELGIGQRSSLIPDTGILFFGAGVGWGGGSHWKEQSHQKLCFPSVTAWVRS